MTRSSTTFLMGVLCLVAATARGDVKTCVQSAKQAYTGCNSACKSSFLDDRASCRGVAPACLSECIDERETCITNAEASLDACISTNCTSIVTNGKATCQTQCSCGGAGNPCGFNACFVKCLDPYEQLRFSCSDNCRNQWQLNGGPAADAACIDQFRTCRAACAPQ